MHGCMGVGVLRGRLTPSCFVSPAQVQFGARRIRAAASFLGGPRRPLYMCMHAPLVHLQCMRHL